MSRWRLQVRLRDDRYGAVVRALLVLLASGATSGCGVRWEPDRKAAAPQPASSPVAPAAPHDSATHPMPLAGRPLQAEAEPPPAADQAATPNAGTKATPPGPEFVLVGPPKNSLATDSRTLPAAMKAERIELNDAQGRRQFQFKNKGADAVKFYDAAGAELCKLTVSTDKLKAKTADDRPLFELKFKSDRSSLRIAPDDREQFKFKPRGERIEIESAEGRLTHRIRRDGPAIVLEDVEGKRVCRAVREGGRTTVYDSADRPVLQSASVDDPLALLFFGWPDLNPTQQAACLVYFLRKSPQ